MKVLHPHLLSDAKATSRFIQERHALSRVSHPNVVQVVELVVERDQLSIVMELVEGGDLKQLHQRAKPRPSEAVTMVARIADALVALHAAGVVHRDLKPANVLIEHTANGPTPKLTDFGLSRLVEEGMSQSSAAVGTPLYMAPEAVDRASTVGPPADVYALGVMLFEFLVGVPPFAQGGAMAILKAHHDQPPPLVAGVPAELQTLIRQMLAKDPSDRPTAVRVRDMLWELLGRVDDSSTPRAAPDETGESEAADRPLLYDDGDLTVAAAGLPVTQNRSFLLALPEPRQGPSRRLLLLGVTALALVVLAGGLVAIRVRGGASVDLDAVSFAFDPELVGEGGIATRHWSLSSDGGLLTGEVTVFNGGGAPLSLDYVEILPASLGVGIADVRFTPDPVERLEADRAATLRVEDLDPAATTRFTYTVDVEPGDGSLQRLSILAQDQVAARQAFFARQENADREEPQSLDLTQLAITPAELTLDVGQERDFVLTGQLADGSAAPLEALAAAAWSTSDPTVAAMAGNRLVSRAAGAATVTAQIGDSVATAALMVNRPLEVLAGPRATDSPDDTGSTTTIGRPETTPPPPEPGVVPGPPGPLAVVKGPSLTSVGLTWGAPADSGNQAVDSYEVRAVDGTAKAVTGPSATVDGLLPATAYQFEARAHNSAGWGPWGGTSGPFLTAERPGNPNATAPKAGKVTETSAEITFHTDSCVTAYYHLGGTSFEWMSQGWPEPWKRGADCWVEHNHLFTGLKPATTYTVAVDLLDTAKGRYSTPPVSFTTDPVTTTLTVTATSGTTATVVATSSLCGVLTITASGGGGSASNGPSCDTSFTHTFTGLTPGTTYSFTLAGTAGGSSIPGRAAAGSTNPPTTQPSVTAAKPTVTGTFFTTTSSRPTTIR